MSQPNRLGVIPRDSLTPAQKEMDDMVRGYHGPEKKPVMYNVNDDLAYGPFPPMFRYPDVGKHWVDLGMSVLKIGGGLPQKVQEVAILTLGAETKAAYLNYGHGISAGEAGLNDEEIGELHAGRFPQSLGKEERAAYEVARELCGKPGALDEKVWKHAVESVGKEGASAIVFMVAYYSFTCTVLNGFDVQVPEGM